MSYRINKFKERYEYLNEWLLDTLNYEEHRSLSIKATLEVYEDQRFYRLFINCIFYPL